MMKTKVMLMLDQNLLRNHLYNTFALLPMAELNDMIPDIEVEVHQEIIISRKTTNHKADIALYLEIDLVMTKVLLLHNTLDHDMSTIKKIRVPIALFTDLLSDPLIDVTLVTYRSRSYSRDNNNFARYTSSYRPPSRPRDSRSSRSRSPSTSNARNKLNTIQPQAQNHPINFKVHMYHPTEMANAVTPTSWFYALYTDTPSNQFQRDYSSRLGIPFLLDSGASISVLNYPTYVTIAELLSIEQNNPSKTLTLANQTEIPILNMLL